jgi:signal transduction histidine kinase
MVFVMAWFIQRNYSLFMGDELGISSQVIDIVRREQRLLEWSLLVLFLIGASISFGASLFVTHRLTGPVINLQHHLWHLCRGDWSRDFRLRKNDEFKELETLVNDLRKNQIELSKQKLER